jgi:hypothetical protein
MLVVIFDETLFTHCQSSKGSLASHHSKWMTYILDKQKDIATFIFLYSQTDIMAS